MDKVLESAEIRATTDRWALNQLVCLPSLQAFHVHRGMQRYVNLVPVLSKLKDTSSRADYTFNLSNSERIEELICLSSYPIMVA